MPDWIMYTVGVISHFMTTLSISALVVFLADPRVKYINIRPGAYVGPIGVIAFWMWFFFG